MTIEHHLYQIKSAEDCKTKTGTFLMKGELMRGSCCGKEAFSGAVEVAEKFGLTEWHIEVRDEHASSHGYEPFDVYQFYNGSGSYPHPVEVYVIGRHQVDGCP